jgi:hypothetical protein
MGAIPHEESVDARQHRYLLRTADRWDLYFVHVRAVDRLSDAERAALLDTLSEAVEVGGRTRPSDTRRLGTSLVLAERRRPGIVLRRLADGLRDRLASAVLEVPESSALLTGYDAWDGAEPEHAEHVDSPSKEWKDVDMSPARDAVLGQNQLLNQLRPDRGAGGPVGP